MHCQTCTWRFPAAGSAHRATQGNYPCLVQMLTGDDFDIDRPFDNIQNVFPDDLVLNCLIHESLNGYASDIAKVVYHLGQHRFVASSIGEPSSTNEPGSFHVWCENKHVWKKSNGSMRQFVREVVAPLYEKTRQYYSDHTADPQLRSVRSAKIATIIKRLKSRDVNTVIHFTFNRFWGADRRLTL